MLDTSLGVDSEETVIMRRTHLKEPSEAKGGIPTNLVGRLALESGEVEEAEANVGDRHHVGDCVPVGLRDEERAAEGVAEAIRYRSNKLRVSYESVDEVRRCVVVSEKTMRRSDEPEKLCAGTNYDDVQCKVSLMRLDDEQGWKKCKARKHDPD